jgi:hypothetical protein
MLGINKIHIQFAYTLSLSLSVALQLVTQYIDHLYTQPVATLYRSLSYTDWYSQSIKSITVPVAWEQLLKGDVPLPLYSRTMPVPHLLASHSNSSQPLNCRSLTPRRAAISQQPPSLLFTA